MTPSPPTAAPAATPQQPTAAQLDELERLEREATPAPWDTDAEFDVLFGPNDDDTGIAFDHPPDARLIALLRNAAPALIAGCRAAGAATPPQQQPECEAQTWEEFIDWYRPVTFRDGRPEWSPAIERHMRAAWDHQQKTINALDTISHAKGAELERIASLVGYAGAKPGGLRDAVADALAAGAGAATPPAESLRDDWPAPLDPGAAAYTLTAKEVAAINRAGELRGGAGAATPALTAAELHEFSATAAILRRHGHVGSSQRILAIRDRLLIAAPAATAGGVAAAPSPTTEADSDEVEPHPEPWNTCPKCGQYIGGLPGPQRKEPTP